MKHLVCLIVFLVGYNHSEAGEVPTGNAGLNFKNNYTGIYFDPLNFLKYNGLPNNLDESGLTVLLNKIHTKFDRIMVPLEGRNSSNDLVPETVARQNRNGGNVTPMEVIILYRPDDNLRKKNNRIEMQRVRQIADSSNQVFPGTVKSILLEMGVDSKQPSSLQLKRYLEFAQLFSANCDGDGYHLGIQLDIGDSQGYQISNFENILRFGYPDKVYFRQSLSNQNTPADSIKIEGVVNRLMKDFENSRKLVESTNPDIKVGFITTWPDTDVDGQGKYSSFVDFWQRMNSWAGESKTSLFLLNAFDSPLEPNLMLKTNGWWRLLPNSSYQHPSDFIFEDKLAPTRSHLGSEEPHRANLTWLRKETEFSKDQVGILVRPIGFQNRIANSDNLNIEVSQEGLVQMVAGQFSKFLIPIESDNGEVPILSRSSNKQHHISRIVALLNKNESVGGTGNSLELIMTFDQTTQKEVLQLAGEANQIFPSTINLLLYRPTYQMNNLSKIMMTSLTSARRIMNGIGFYKVGIQLPIELCQDYDSSPDFKAFLRDQPKKLKIIYFSATISPAYSRLGLGRVFPQLVVRLENCKKDLEQYFPKLSVGFVTGWPITNRTNFPQHLQFLKFWDGINEWAVRANTSVFLSSAFDTPFSPVGENPSIPQYGWWGLIGLHRSDMPKSFRFQTRKEIALQHVKGNMSSDDDDDDDPITHSTLLEPLPISVIILVCALFLTLITIRHHHLRSKSQYLSNDEIHAFFNGGEPKSSGKNSDRINRPYNKKIYELAKTSFKIDHSYPLGSGRFGRVCRGTIQPGNGGSLEEVAVKMTKDNSTRAALKGLIYEIKILSFLGNHPFIVELKGAYSAELKKSRAFIFLELCELGSLKSYLSKFSQKKGSLEDRDGDNFEGVSESSTSADGTELDESLVNDMLRWSGEIANGMDYIASKHIVHMDLASRNILLTIGKTAKITDFGLSRRMYNYQCYCKETNEQESLPWRSMAPESLRRLEFTEKSDVWGFGVTLWEIFTVREEPYAGLSWNVNFPTQLERGLRLETPIHNPKGIYLTMLHCWSKKPEKRPTFTELATKLYQNSEGNPPPPNGSHSAILTMPSPNNESTCANPDKKYFKKEFSPPPNLKLKWSSVSVKLVSLAIILLILIATTTTMLWTCMLPNNQNSHPQWTNTTNTNLTSSTEDVVVHRKEGLDGNVPFPVDKTSEDNYNNAYWLTNLNGTELSTNDKTLFHLFFSAEPTMNPAQLHGLVTFLIDKNHSSLLNATPSHPFLTTWLPLVIANLEVMPETLSLLQRNCINFVNIMDGKDRSLLFYAMEGRRSLKLLVTLISLGAYPDQVDKLGRNLLHVAAKVGYLEGIKFMLNLGSRIDVVDFYGNTPLHEVSQSGKENSLEIIHFLVENGANVNALDEPRQNALHKAAYNNYDMEVTLMILKYLISNKADVFHEDYMGHVFLHVLLREGTRLTTAQLYDITKYLISKGYSTLFDCSGGPEKGTPFQWAVNELEMDERTVSLLNQSGVNFNAIDRRGASLLFYAVVGRRSPKLVSLLIQYGANPKVVRRYDQSLVHLAAENGNWEVLPVLLNSGLDIDAVDTLSYTPLHRVAAYGKENVVEIVKFLVENGADVNAQNRQLGSPLEFATINPDLDMDGRVQVLKYLIEHGADVFRKENKYHRTFLHEILGDVRKLNSSKFHELTQSLVRNGHARLFEIPGGNNDATPMHWAARYIEVEGETLALLNISGVSFNTVDKLNQSVPFFTIYGRRSPTLLNNLFRFGADPGHLRKGNSGLLHAAAKRGRLVITMLINLGLDVNGIDANGDSPLHFAIKFATDDILDRVRILAGSGANVTLANANGLIPLVLAMARSDDDMVGKESIIKFLETKGKFASQ